MIDQIILIPYISQHNGNWYPCETHYRHSEISFNPALFWVRFPLVLPLMHNLGMIHRALGGHQVEQIGYYPIYKVDIPSFYSFELFYYVDHK